MKYLIVVTLFLLAVVAYGQETRINPHTLNPMDQVDGGPALANDTTYDVHFYHIDLEIAIDSPYLSGSVSYLVTSNVEGLNSLTLDLDDAFTVDSISAPASSFDFSNDQLTVYFSNTYDQGDAISFTVHYSGAPVLAGGYKGLRYETHDGDEPIIASLSTPYLAHTWWPCKDGTSDKADSTYIDITIADTTINSFPVIVVSNGLLDAVETAGSKKTFKWKHLYPAVPYYLMVAISNYNHFQQTFNGPGYDFPIDYYVFDSHMASAQNGVAQLPEVMDFFTEHFGPYPFLSEKYAMTQLGYYGGIENQTNSIVNNMSLGWFYVSVHELAHQWFADMITCETWHHGWLNEGFASYSEALYSEHANGFGAYQNYMTEYEFYNEGTLYLEDVSNPFSGVFKTIIYHKGAYVLHMLRGILGDAAFFDALHSYATHPDFKYKHATTEDFQSVFENESGLDLGYFFEQWIYDERYPKYSYNYNYGPSSGNLDLTIVQTQANLGWREVFTMPVPVKVGFTDGSDSLVTVFNDAQTQYYSFSFGKEVNSVELDPEKWILREVEYDPGITVDITEVEQDLFELYPNPSTGTFIVKIPSLPTKEDIHVQVLDVNGKVQYHSALAANQGGESTIEIGTLAPGIYFLNLSAGDIHHHQKIVVSR